MLFNELGMAYYSNFKYKSIIPYIARISRCPFKAQSVNPFKIQN